MKSRCLIIGVSVLAGFLPLFAAQPIVLTSSAFPPGGMIPPKFTCKGFNHPPPLRWENVPREAKALVLIMDDPDAPGGNFTHWLIWNLNPATTRLGEGSVPNDAVQGTNDFGQQGYGGPCPPSGTHRYSFRLFALDRKLDLQAGAKRAELERALQSHVIARGELMARFSH